LFHLGYFRRAVYSIPPPATATVLEQTSLTQNSHNNSSSKGLSITLALQRLFYLLQVSDQSVSTRELTRSFGWDAYESFIQHDVQELNRVLCDTLEEKMKDTPAQGTIQKLFTGKIVNWIKCTNIDYKSTRVESFYGK
jgi:ubiquitin carboxyl-terminal hydrolase 7